MLGEYSPEASIIADVAPVSDGRLLLALSLDGVELVRVVNPQSGSP